LLLLPLLLLLPQLPLLPLLLDLLLLEHLRGVLRGLGLSLRKS